MSKQMLKGLHRRALGISPDDEVMAPFGLISGGDGEATIVHPSPSKAAIFDDFLGDVVADEWSALEGDTGHTQAIQAGTGGVYRLANSATATATPAGGQSLVSALNWKANQGPGGASGELRLAARVKVSDYAVGSVFVGFTDNVSFEMPAYDTGGGVITPAADCVGLLIGENNVLGSGWTGVSAKSTAGDSGDQSVLLDTGAPTNNKYQDLELVVSRGISDTGGQVTFFIDGVNKGYLSSPIASNVALTPVIAVMDVDAAGAPIVDIDWINVSAPRDTGI